MSGPTASSIAQHAGITQTIATPKSTGVKTTRESEQSRVPAGGDDDDHKEGQASGKSGGTGSAGGSGKTTTGRAQQQQQNGPVRRKRVKLKDVSQKEVRKQSEAKESALARETSRPGEAKMGPAQARELGYKRAASILAQLSRLTESSIKYETAQRLRDHEGNVLSPKAQQKWMLTNLINYTNICLQQHTGGKAGEAYESRRDWRLIYMALRGLFDGQMKQEKGTGDSTRKGMSKGEYQMLQKKALGILRLILEPEERPDDQEEYYEVA
jgi:hypothetical protein